MKVSSPVAALNVSDCVTAAVLEADKYEKAIFHLAVADLVTRLAGLVVKIHPAMADKASISVNLKGLEQEQAEQCKAALSTGWTDVALSESEVCPSARHDYPVSTYSLMATAHSNENRFFRSTFICTSSAQAQTTQRNKESFTLGLVFRSYDTDRSIYPIIRCRPRAKRSHPKTRLRCEKDKESMQKLYLRLEGDLTARGG